MVCDESSMLDFHHLRVKRSEREVLTSLKVVSRGKIELIVSVTHVAVGGLDRA